MHHGNTQSCPAIQPLSIWIEILEQPDLADGGSTSDSLEELVNSGFVATFYAFGKKKKEIGYRLTEEFSLFYLKFIENKRGEGAGTWGRLSQTQPSPLSQFWRESFIYRKAQTGLW